MRLKRLMLQGYKTFASKTEFEFDSGITSIIGPNGSGKSNVADAVRWVLGEQSYSTLRGKRTTDMIFTGSHSRPRAGMAQVSLMLDNSDGWLPVDYTEVEIGRRAFRSGENEYVLNGQKVRLKDILDLLATSGLAEGTYTIIGQGLVDQALSLRADERRALFEEAAGISHYKAKRAQTLRRLEETQRNLERVHDILAEIRPRLASLKRQATRARNYEQIAVDLRQLLRLWYGYKWEQAKEKIRHAREMSASVEIIWRESRDQLQQFQDQIDAERKRISQVQQQMANMQATRESIRERLVRVQREIAVQQERQQSVKRQLEEIDRERPALLEQQAGARQELDQAVAELEVSKETLRAEQIQLEQSGNSQSIQTIQARLEDLRRQQKQRQEARQRLIRELKQLRQAQRNHEHKLNQSRSEVAGLAAKVDLLNQMRYKETGVSQDVVVIGQFVNLITIPGRFRKALEAALRRRLATLVVPEEGEIWRLIHESSPNEPLSAIALADVRPPSSPAAPDDPAVIGWASELVSCEAEIRPLAQLLLGQVLLLRNDPQAAYRIAKLLPSGVTVVTQDGLAVHAGGLVERGGHDAQNSILAREKEWQQARQALEKAQAVVVQQEQVADELQSAIQEKQDVVDEGQHDEAKLEDTYRELSEELSQARQQQQIWRQGLNSTRTIVAGRQAVVDSRQSTLNQVDRQLGRLGERQEALLRQQKQLGVRDDESVSVQLSQQLKELDEQLEPLQGQIKEIRVNISRLEQASAETRRQAHDRETSYTQVKIALSQQQTEMAGLQERIKADLGIVALHYDMDQTGPTPLPMSDVVEQLPQISELPEDIEETIQNYRGQMQRMGAVNPDAPVEYEETETRYDFLTQQVEDLNQTEVKLRQVIAELDELTSRAFVDTVEKVNTIFGETFTKLFGGGSARLALTDPDDLTISGVDIIARLPNRREQGLALLSGGERSLTATALIFSLLKVAPTPFCIMDEVDAALDEANIGRFRELLLELSQNTQFIIITHNRGTVQAAQTLYGISMGPDSVSQAISIKLEEYVKQASLV